MSKRALLVAAVAVLLAIPLGAAYAETAEVPSRIVELRNQIMALRQELVRERVKAGFISEEQADLMLERMQQAFTRRAEMNCRECPEGERQQQMFHRRLKHRLRLFPAPGERPGWPGGSPD